jgi:hypothetical protein
MLDLSQFDDPLDFEEALTAAYRDAAFSTAAIAKLGQVRIALERQSAQAEYDLMLAEHAESLPFFARCAAAESAGFNQMML